MKYFRDQSSGETTKEDIYVDKLFPPEDYSILSKEYQGQLLDEKLAEKIIKEIHINQIEWARFSKKFDINKIDIFQGIIGIEDIKQGCISKCNFLTALSLMTKYSELIYKLFPNKSVSMRGYYEVILFIDGELQIIIVDDYFPFIKNTNLVFAQSNGTELWVILLEKAWAKVNGGTQILLKVF